MLDIRKIVFSLSLPGLIILAAWYIQSMGLGIAPDYAPLVLLLPYVFILSAMALAWIFHHSREFHILLLCGAAYWLLQNPGLLQYTHGLNITLLYSLLCILLPLNVALLCVLGERGIINFHGLKRLAVLVLQAMLIYWLSLSDANLLSRLLQIRFISHPLINELTLPQLSQLVFLFSFIGLGIHLLRNPGLLLAARVSVLVCLWFSLEGTSLVSQQHLFAAMSWFSAIGLMLLAAMVLNSKQLAYLDELTNLPSRRALNQYLATLGRHYSIAMIDIDHFKKVNDRYGHDVGDQVLKMLATHLRRVRGGGRAFRYGGEEFTLVFANRDVHEAAIYADNLREHIASTPFTIRNKRRPKKKPENPSKRQPIKALNVTISIGIAQRNELLLTTEEVFKVADQNLYRAKKKGRNQVVV